MAKVMIGNFKGPQGEQGVKGDPGTAASIQVGTVQTVQPEENAEVTNTGTTTAAVLNFKIPRGADGMTDLTAEYKDDSSYTCQPTVNAPVIVKELDGKTEQVETTGAQLFDASKIPTKSQSGATVTNNGDGSFTISGSGNVSSLFVHSYSYTHEETLKLLKSGNIQLNVDKGTTNPYVYVQIRNEASTYIELNSTSSGSLNGNIESAILENEDTYLSIGIVAQNGSAIVPGTIKPMLYQDGDGTWEPYTGGSPVPSPDYPQVIKGVGGMGYFDGEWRQGLYQSTDGSFSNVNYGICSQNYIPCKKNDVIKIEYGETVPYLIIIFYNSNKNYISASNNSVSGVTEFQAIAPEGVAYFMIDVQYPNNSTITPSTAKYCTVTINGEYQTGVETTGAQLLDYKKIQQESNFCTVEFIENGVKLDGRWYAALNSISVIPDADYCISYVGSGTKKVSIFARGDNGRLNPIITMSSSNPLVFNTGENNNIDILFYASASETPGTATYTNIMLNAGSTALPYQPYHHTTLSIPLTSPLYEGDKICYVKPGESYVDADGTTVIADRILYGVYRENAVVVFDGSEDENWMKSPLRDDLFVIIISNKVISSDEFGGYIKCDRLMYINNNSSASSMPDNSIKADRTDSANRQVFVVVSDAGNEISAFKTWLQSNPLTVLYKLAVPYFEPFTDQNIFYTLRTDDTLSYVYSGDPIEPVLTVEVAKNSTGGYLLESYAQAQKNAISEANSQSRLSAIEQQLVNQATTPTE